MTTIDFQSDRFDLVCSSVILNATLVLACIHLGAKMFVLDSHRSYIFCFVFFCARTFERSMVNGMYLWILLNICYQATNTVLLTYTSD